MNTNYSLLFRIELLHEYFLDGKSRDVEIIPTPECVAICKKMNIQLRTNENSLLAFIRANETNEPFENTDSNKSFHKYYDKTVFRFYARLTSPEFLNYTNIEYSFNNGNIFYFSNLAKNKENGLLNLTAPVKDYVAGNTYVPGNLVKDPASGNVYESIKKNVAAAISKKKIPFTDLSLWAPKGLLHLQKPVEEFAVGKYYTQGEIVKKHDTEDLYECIKKHVGKNITDLDDATLWIPRGQGQLQYVTENDNIVYSGDKYFFNLPAAISTATIEIFEFNYDADKPGYTVSVRQEKKQFTKPVTSVNVDLAALGAGKYMLKVNNETAIVYHDPMLSAGNILGVVEIFNHLPASDDYALLDDSEKIKNTSYKIQFANRRVLWKYIRRDGKAKNITDTGETKYEFNLTGEDFVSTIPIPLAENAVKTLKLEFNTKDFGLHPLPNPRVEHLRRFTQDDYDYYCGEVYLNY